MNNIYCLPIISPSSDDALATVQQNMNNYKFFEIWVDYLDQCDDLFLSKVAKLLDGRLIIVFRRQNLEPIRMPMERRLEILRLLSGTKVLVDLDITSQTGELGYVAAHQLSLETLVSYHNYMTTPKATELEHIVNKMRTYSPSIVKLATMCNSPHDPLVLLSTLVKLRDHQQRCIILGMGEYGQATRIFGTLWGNEMIFAPQDKQHASAPGQLTRGELEQIMTILKGSK